MSSELQVYVENFGSREADKCFVAESDGAVGFETVAESDEEYIMLCSLK